MNRWQGFHHNTSKVSVAKAIVTLLTSYFKKLFKHGYRFFKVTLIKKKTCEKTYIALHTWI